MSVENKSERAGGQVTVETEQFTCPNCGGTMMYSIEKKQFQCASCGSVENVRPFSQTVKEYDFSDYRKREAEASPQIGLARAVCAQCGNEIFFEEHETATVCPMCGSSQVSMDKQMTGIPPEGIIPFQIDRYQGQRLFQKWIKKRWFAPNDLKKLYAEGALKGIYVPYWTYDANTAAYYRGEGGKSYTVRDKDGHTQTRVRWRNVSGRVEESFNDIQVCAAEASLAETARRVSPYNTTENTRPFSPVYLSGYHAQHYSVKADEGFAEAKTEMEAVLRDRARDDILRKGYDQARVDTLETTYYDVTYKHVLLPIWAASFGYKGKTYSYAINGETGRVGGSRPYSLAKIAVAVLAAIAAVVLVFFLCSKAEAAELPGGPPTSVCAAGQTAGAPENLEKEEDTLIEIDKMKNLSAG